MRDHHWPSHWGLSLRMANEKMDICSKYGFGYKTPSSLPSTVILGLWEKYSHLWETLQGNLCIN